MLRFLCFYKVIVAEKACSNIYRFDIPLTCTGDQNLTVLSDVRCCSSLLRICANQQLVLTPYLPARYARTLPLFVHYQIDTMKPIMQRIGFLVLYCDIYVAFYLMMYFHFVVLPVFQI